MSDLSDFDKEKNSISGGGWGLQADYVENWAFLEDVFSPEECQEIIEIGNKQIVRVATVLGNRSLNEIRKSSVSWLFPSGDNNWIFQRLTDVVNHVNNSYFKFDLHSFSEGLQFTKYYAPDGFYSRHIDRSTNNGIRKLSLSIQLNESDEFDGGNLCLFCADKPDIPTMKQGKMIAFPSYVLHEVTPVTRGTRYSLVAWISGPPFK